MGPLSFGLIAAVAACGLVVAVGVLKPHRVLRCVMASLAFTLGFGGMSIQAAPSAFAVSCPGLECQSSGYVYGGSTKGSIGCTYMSTDINDIHGSPDMWTYGSVDALQPGGGCRYDGTVNSTTYLLVVRQDLYKWESTSLGWGWVLVNHGPWVGDLIDTGTTRRTHDRRTEYAWHPPSYYGAGYYSVDGGAFQGDGFTWYGGYRSASWTGWIS